MKLVKTDVCTCTVLTFGTVQVISAGFNSLILELYIHFPLSYTCGFAGETCSADKTLPMDE